MLLFGYKSHYFCIKNAATEYWGRGGWERGGDQYSILGAVSENMISKTINFNLVCNLSNLSIRSQIETNMPKNTYINSDLKG